MNTCQSVREAEKFDDPRHADAPSQWESRSILIRDIQVGRERKDVLIRLVESGEHIQSACDLLNERYAWRGYGAHHRIPRDQNYTTFTAEIDGDIVGTITLAVDIGNGLAADRAHGEELAALRSQPGSGLCELTKFAFEPSLQSKELMAALFHTVFVYGARTFGCTDLVVEVVSRHVRFYEAMLGLKRLGEMKHNQIVHRPVQLMGLKVSAIREYIDALAATGAAATRSLYPYFFSPQREDAIYRALAPALDAGPRAMAAPIAARAVAPAAALH